MTRLRQVERIRPINQSDPHIFFPKGQVRIILLSWLLYGITYSPSTIDILSPLFQGLPQLSASLRPSSSLERVGTESSSKKNDHFWPIYPSFAPFTSTRSCWYMDHRRRDSFPLRSLESRKNYFRSSASLIGITKSNWSWKEVGGYSNFFYSFDSS